MTEAEPRLEDFTAANGAGRPQVVWRRLVDDLETPVSAYLKIAAGRPFTFLFESVEGGAWRGRYSIVAMAPDLIWRCRGEVAEVSEAQDLADGVFRKEADGPLASLKALTARSRIELPRELPPMAAGIFGVVGYDMVRLVERLPAANPDPLGLPDALLMRPSIVAIFDSVAHEIVLVTTVRPSSLPAKHAWDDAIDRLNGAERALRSNLPPRKAPEPSDGPTLETPVSREAYGAIVERAKAYIAAGDIFQVVPSHRMSARHPGDPFAFYRALRRLNPSPFMYYLNFGGFQLAGSSPEILVRLRDGKVTIRPIAGTRPRGATPEEDARLEQELLADPKERAEHLMLLDLGRNDVGRVAKLGGAEPHVRVTESFAVERYSHVMHIVSNVEGDARPDLDPVDALMAALPAGTLSGAPKVRAMEIIDELEEVKRGVGYAGAVGYIGAGGDLDTCIVLRTALFKDGTMYVQAGGGVVADSDAGAEYDETLHKAGALAKAAREAWRFA